MQGENVACPLRKSPVLVAILVTTGIGVAMGWLGPFGSYLNEGRLALILYWTAASWAGLLLFGGALHLIKRSMVRASTIGRVAISALAIAALSVVQTGLTRAAAHAIWPTLQRVGPDWWTWYGQVFGVAALVTTGFWVWPRLVRTGHRQKLHPSLHRSVGQEALGSDVIALQMEDHYVRVHRAARSDLLLMPMTQAIAAMGTVEGFRTHRSWWVARHAVTAAVGPPRSMRLVLANGLTAPVARAAVAHLREAGWLDQTASLADKALLPR